MTRLLHYQCSKNTLINGIKGSYFRLVFDRIIKLKPIYNKISKEISRLFHKTLKNLKIPTIYLLP